MKHTAPHMRECGTLQCNGIVELINDDFSEISAQMIQFMHFLTGDLVNVSQAPAFLTIYKQQIQNDITLIDLPSQSFVDRQ